MATSAKITPADYPDLLAAADAGVSQHELARRYDCAPSLVARHLKRARRARDGGHLASGDVQGANGEPHAGSLRELLEARIRDPKTSPRDLASLTNALARVPQERPAVSDGASIFDFPRGTIILEPGPRGLNLYRLLMRVRGGLEHVSAPQYDLDGDDALFLLLCALGSGSGLKAEDLPNHPLRAQGAKLLRRHREERDATDLESEDEKVLPEGVYEVFPLPPLSQALLED